MDSYRPAGHHRRTMVRIALINLLLLLVGLAAVELVFGRWFDERGFVSIEIPRNVAYEFDTGTLYPGSGRMRYSRDAHGLRGDYGAPLDVGLLVLGGSTTNELYVDYDETWTARLQALFREGGRDIRVANAGVDGHSTVGHLWALEVWLPKVPALRPSHVLVYAGINDLRVGDDGDGVMQVRARNWPKRLRQAIRNDSAVYGLYRTVRGVAVAYRARLTHDRVDFADALWTPGSPDVDDEACGDFAAEAYARRLDRLSRLIRQRGAVPVYVTQVGGDVRRVGDDVVRYLADREEDARALDCVNAVTLAHCRREGLRCIDLARELHFADGDHYDHVHTTPAGSEKIARYLYDRLRDLPIRPAAVGAGP